MRILLGGAFDPVHTGHIRLALYIHHEFQQPVKFLPLNGVPNYKAPLQASLSQRLDMLKLIILKYPTQLGIDYSETKFNTYSPTYVTLNRLRQRYGTKEAIYFIIGSDSLVTLDSWDNWQQLFTLTNFIVAIRPEYPLSKMSKTLASTVIPRLCAPPAQITHPKLDLLPPNLNPTTLDTSQNSVGQIIMLNLAPTPESSTMIRKQLKDTNKVNSWLPSEIKQYIITHNLYKGN